MEIAQPIPLMGAATTSSGERAGRVPPPRVPLGLWNTSYLVAVISAGVLAVLASIRALIAAPVEPAWYVLTILTVVSGAATLNLPNFPVAFSISDSFTITAALLFGPAAGAVTVAIDTLVISGRLARRRFVLRRFLFNITAPALAMWTAAQVFFWLAGVEPLSHPSASLQRLVGPLVVFTGVYFVLNTGLIARAIAFEQQLPVLVVWRRHFSPLWLTYFGGAAVAALLIALIHAHGADPITLAFVAPIPFILYATLKGAVGRLEDQLGHLGHVNRLYLATIETLAHAIDAKDQVTHGHIRRVQQRALRLATALGVHDETELRAIEAASLLHDTGKLAIPEHILNKPGKLTPAEFERMKEHATIGAEILSSIDFPYPVVPIVRHHHENWDGSGYPLNLTGTAIPLGARILSVVDCFDALTSDRPYRPKMSPVEAIAILQQRSGSMYDPDVVNTFVALYAEGGLEPESAAMASDALVAITKTVQSASAANRTLTETWSDRRALEAFYDLGTALANVTELSVIADRLHRVVEALMRAACSALYLYEADRDMLVARHVAGAHAAAIRGLEVRQGHRITGWVAAQRATITNSDATLDLGNLTMRLVPPPQTCLCTALCVDGQLVGVLTVYSTSPEPFTERHAAIVDALAPRIAVAVQKSTRPRSDAGREDRGSRLFGPARAKSAGSSD